MHLISILIPFWAIAALFLPDRTKPIEPPRQTPVSEIVAEPSATNPMVCNCTITQAGATYAINALMGNVSGSAFYSYGTPNASSANTGLEQDNGLVLFLYEDITTGIVSFILIADIANSGSGGSMEFELNCLPNTAFVSVQDDAGEFNGSPPLITGQWDWSTCCTDGGVIEDVGCNVSYTLDLLISSGIDSISWLTGDIANPTIIPLSLTGEIITVDCGGGVCCPISFDAAMDIMNADCPDTPTGSIDLTPQDGIPPYTYDWSNGETTEDIDDLVAGTYTVTITDSQGCSEELVMTVDVNSDTPPAIPASIDLCSSDAMDFFDLTTVEDIINAGSGFDVLWFENVDMTSPIANPSNYFSGPTTVYAVVDNGACLSEVVPVVLDILPEPVANPASLNACEENNEMATFDLTSLENTVSGGNGTVDWFEDPNLNIQISDPELFFSESTTVYATVFDGTCYSDPAEVILIVDLKPEGFSTDMNLCGDANDEAVFDLTLMELFVSGGNGSVDWYLEIELLDEITTPSAFQTTSTTVYAVVFDGICFSDPVPVELNVDATPVANSITAQLCDEGSGTAVFNLWDYANQVSGGIGTVEWFLDEFLTDPVLNPGAFLTASTIIYAIVENNGCISAPVLINLEVVASITGNPTSMSTCTDTSGQGVFNLVSIESIVSGGSGIVAWFEDALGTIPITTPSAFSSTGTTVYAQVTLGNCISGFIPVNLMAITSVVATSTQLMSCDDGNGSAIFNLLDIDTVVSGGVGQVNWFLDSLGAMVISPANAFMSTDTVVYASVTAGTCVSDIVPIDLVVIPSPVAFIASMEVCEDANAQAVFNLLTLDMQVSGNSGNVSWYGDPLLTMPLLNPSSFQSADTVVYATVTNGDCVSPAVPIFLNVLDLPVALPVTIQACAVEDDTVIINLTLSDVNVSGGAGTVLWFTDINGLNPVSNPSAFATGNNTVYATVTSNGCISGVAAITIEVETSTIPLPVCSYTSIDSLAVSWSSLADLYELSYTINGQVIGVPWTTNASNFNLGSLGLGDTLTLTINALYDSICTTPLTSSITCITDLCATQVIDFVGLGTSYCRDEPYIVIVPNPPGGQLSGPGISGDTLYPSLITGNTASIFYTWEDVVTGCIYDYDEQVQIVDPLSMPLVNCGSSTLNSVTFDWTANATQFGYEYVINQGSTVGPTLTGNPSIVINNLSEGDSVTLTVWSVGPPPCGNSDSVTVTCFAKPCPVPDISISDPGLICSDDGPFPLDLNIVGLPGTPQIIWTGQGISDPSGIFDPANAVIGLNAVGVTIQDGGCYYDAAIDINVYETPIALFNVDGVPCIDSLIHITFNGNAGINSLFTWDYSGGNVVSGNLPLEFYLQWDSPGTYDVSLEVEDQGCISEPANTVVQIDAPLESPVITCLEEDYFSVVVEWAPVIGATQYNVTSNNGTGKLNGNTYTVSNLQDNSSVSITVQAIGPSVCGPSIATIECHTLDYVAPEIYIPDIFSPDHDGINDIFYIQSNAQITEINAMRIFDRWGEVLFEELLFPPNDPAFGWDGSFSEKLLNPGVYLYWVEYKTIDGDVITETGDITLIR